MCERWSVNGVEAIEMLESEWCVVHMEKVLCGGDRMACGRNGELCVEEMEGVVCGGDGESHVWGWKAVAV